MIVNRKRSGVTPVFSNLIAAARHESILSFFDRFDLLKPEELLYAPDDMGSMQFVAAEYGVPIPDMDSPPPAPEGFTGTVDDWEINTEFQMWTLHVWIELENPSGIFTAHNPVLP